MGKSIAANAFTLLIVALLALSGGILWGKAEYTKPGPLTEPVVFTLERGEGLVSASARLAEAGVISNDRIFRIAARYSGQDTKLKFGEYEFSAGVSMQDALGILVSGRSIQYFVTLPEGLYSSEIVKIINANEFLVGEIETLPAEGMLAPETYSFQRGDSRQSIIDRMTRAQEQILDEAWANRAEGLPLASKEDLLILSSIVESEAGGAGEWALVASVFYNRMAANMRLEADATIRYGLTEGAERLRRGLRQSELDRETPYNTYFIKGLTPTPISNPGKDAIFATANPAESKYYYFVLDGSGGHAFAQNYAEHQENVRRWRAIERERSN
ncbi:MAG TPA: endolytic transglycosylase MltG [Paracoccaceae bacterium]|nr:endolytic transglycosylase MltG [Paracoccaceae bacterium]